MTEPVYNEKTGMQVIEDPDKGQRNDLIGGLVKEIILVGIGYGIASGIHAWGSTELYEERIELAKSYDAQWAILGLVIFTALNHWKIYYVNSHKARLMDWTDGKNRPNSYYYRLATDKAETGSAIVFNLEGDVGKYNMANRSTYMFMEMCLGFLASVYLVFFLYPFPAFVLFCLFAFGRIIFQIGFAAYGRGAHLPGFLLDLISRNTVAGLLIIATYKSF